MNFKMIAIIVTCALLISAAIAFIEFRVSGTSASSTDVPVEQLPTPGPSSGGSGGFAPPTSGGGAQGQSSADSPALNSASFNVQKTAALKTVARTLDAQFKSSGKYPDSFSYLAADTPGVDSSFNYQTTGPDAYSLCAKLMNSDQDCITSDTSGATFVIPYADLNIATFREHYVRFSGATSSDDFAIDVPPGWVADSDPSIASYSIKVRTDVGDSLTLARFNLKNYLPHVVGESLKSFSQEFAAQFPANIHVIDTELLPGADVPAYQLIGTDTEGSQKFDFIFILRPNSTGFQEIDFLAEDSMFNRMDPVLQHMAGSILYAR